MQMWINEVNKSNSHLLIAYQHDFHGRDNSAFFESKFTSAVEKAVVGLSGGSTSTYILVSDLCFAAEDEGFEPSVGCPTHAFQACALGRYANPPLLLTRLKGIGGDD